MIGVIAIVYSFTISFLDELNTKVILFHKLLIKTPHMVLLNVAKYVEVM